VAIEARLVDDGAQIMETMMSDCSDARLELLLHAVCALASALPPDARDHTASTLDQRMSGAEPSSEACDTAVAAGLARILGALRRGVVADSLVLSGVEETSDGLLQRQAWW